MASELIHLLNNPPNGEHQATDLLNWMTYFESVYQKSFTTILRPFFVFFQCHRDRFEEIWESFSPLLMQEDIRRESPTLDMKTEIYVEPNLLKLRVKQALIRHIRQVRQRSHSVMIVLILLSDRLCRQIDFDDRDRYDSSGPPIPTLPRNF
jgi:hypothetical protein